MGLKADERNVRAWSAWTHVCTFQPKQIVLSTSEHVSILLLCLTVWVRCCVIQLADRQSNRWSPKLIFTVIKSLESTGQFTLSERTDQMYMAHNCRLYISSVFIFRQVRLQFGVLVLLYRQIVKASSNRILSIFVTVPWDRTTKNTSWTLLLFTVSKKRSSICQKTILLV